MGTRADFYVGRGSDAEWLGSIAFDGYRVAEMKQDGIKGNDDYMACWSIKTASNESGYRTAVSQLLALNDDATTPDQGWPWPWEDSQTTDYAYAFDGERVWVSRYGREWFNPQEEQPEHDSGKVAVFPNMKDRAAVTFGKRSGLIVLGA